MGHYPVQLTYQGPVSGNDIIGTLPTQGTIREVVIEHFWDTMAIIPPDRQHPRWSETRALGAEVYVWWMVRCVCCVFCVELVRNADNNCVRNQLRQLTEFSCL